MGSDRARIEALIPHRPPFLFVDRIVEEGEGRILTEWHVPEDLDCFRGHYPGQPILPGVILTEFCLQSGALLIYVGEGPSAEHAGVPVMTKIEDARFRQVVRPGDQLTAEVELVETLANARYCTAKVSREGKAVARLKFVLAVAEEGA